MLRVVGLLSTMLEGWSCATTIVNDRVGGAMRLLILTL